MDGVGDIFEDVRSGGSQNFTRRVYSQVRGIRRLISKFGRLGLFE